MDYELLYEFFQKYFVMQEQWDVKDAFSTYVWDLFLWCQLLYVVFLLLSVYKRDGCVLVWVGIQYYNES